MSQTPEPPMDPYQQASDSPHRRQASPREEAALPVAAAPGGTPASKTESPARTALQVVGVSLAVSVVMSIALEYAGWQIAFKNMPTPHAPIPPLAFLRGVWDTTLGSVGIGAAAVAASLLLPSTWRNAWRRVPAAFAMGSLAFIAFLSFVTFGFLR